MNGGIGVGAFDGVAPDSAEHVIVSAAEVPVTILTIPQAWALVMPCGCIDGIMWGSERHPTAESVMLTFYPNKRSRQSHEAKGWLVRAASTDDIEAAKVEPTHEGHA